MKRFLPILMCLSLATVAGCVSASGSVPRRHHAFRDTRHVAFFAAAPVSDPEQYGLRAVTAYLAGIERAAEDAAQEAAEAEAVSRANQRAVTPGQPSPVQGPPRSWDSFAACVTAHESGGNPTAQNPHSSASGLFQDLDSTWGGYGGYSRAMYAPVEVQYAMNYELWSRAGSSPWAGSGC